MEIKTVTEIVEVNRNDDEAVQTILQCFLNKQKSYGSTINPDSPQYENIKILTELLLMKNKESTNIPIVANIPMGQGKSSLLVEFIKYMYEIDKEFGAVIVKKTINECKDFAIDTGILEVEDFKEYEEFFLCDASERRSLYDQSEDFFKTIVVRGFNFKDCKKYTDKTKWWGIAPSDAVEYDYRLCQGCIIKDCTVKKSKWNCQNHRIVTITHTRLFLSADVEELLDALMYFKNEKGKLVKRKLLIIDEKMEMSDVESITINQFKNLKNIIEAEYKDYLEQFDNIEAYLDELKYPEDSSSDILKQNQFFTDSEFEFDDHLRQGFYTNTDIQREQYEKLLTLEKVLNSKNITTSIQFKFGASKKKNNLVRQISMYNYIDLNFYHQFFNKSIILDATARLDMDYQNSNVVYCSDIILSPQQIKVFKPKDECNVSKSKLAGIGLKLNKEKAIEYYSKNVENISRECVEIINKKKEKVLIVVYKTIKGIEEFKFKADIEVSLKNMGVKKEDYRLVHHGEFSTGVNHLSDCKTIIIVGQLNKSSTFYQNKSLSLGKSFISQKVLKKGIIDPVQLNDYLITTIQQIGRTAFRKKEDVEVYLIGRKTVNDMLIGQMEKYFDIVLDTFETTHYYQEPSKQEILLEKIKSENINTKHGQIIKHQVFKEYCKELEMDDSILRNKSFKEKLGEIGIVKNPENNREYVYVPVEKTIMI